MQVVIREPTLKRHRACRGRYDSPYWNAEEQALVYPDWDAAVSHFMESKDGTERLEWLVSNKLVPMTKEQFDAAKTARGGV